MGYRSNVVLAIAPDYTNSFLAMLSTDPELLALVQKGTEIFQHSRYVEGDLFMHWEDTKWYTDYKCVGMIVEWMEAQLPEAYRFARVGEDPDDWIEEGEYMMESITIQREAYVSFDESPFPREVR